VSASTRVLLALDGSVGGEEFRAVLPSEAGVEVVAVIEDGVIAGRTSGADLVVVGCRSYPDSALRLIQSALADNADRPVVALCSGSPNGFVRQALEHGASDVVVLPETPEKVMFALEKSLARGPGRGNGAGQALGRMVTVLGPKGGTGKSVTVSNLAVSLAAAGHTAAVVDLDLQFGDAGLVLGLSPDKTIYDLVTSGGSLDAEKIDAYLATHESGARVLIAPVRPDQAAAVSVDFMREILRVLRGSFDYVVGDTPPDFTPHVIAAVDASTDICIVGMLDALSLKNTKLGLETLALMGRDPSDVTLILNRAGTRVGISDEGVAGVFGRAPEVLVPSDRDIPLSVNEGTPIVQSRPGSPAAKAFRTLAELLAPGEAAAANGASPPSQSKAETRGLFKLVLGRQD
jgi:pilus assembly protein CpaE